MNEKYLQWIRNIWIIRPEDKIHFTMCPWFWLRKDMLNLLSSDTLLYVEWSWYQTVWNIKKKNTMYCFENESSLIHERFRLTTFLFNTARNIRINLANSILFCTFAPQWDRLQVNIRNEKSLKKYTEMLFSTLFLHFLKVNERVTN